MCSAIFFEGLMLISSRPITSSPSLGGVSIWGRKWFLFSIKKLFNNYSIRFHLYPGISAVQTMGKNSILIQLEKNKSLLFTSSGENLILEKSIFLGRNQIINNFCMTISGSLNNSENKNIAWELKKNN